MASVVFPLPDLTALRCWLAAVLGRAVAANGGSGAETSLERLYPSFGEVTETLNALGEPGPETTAPGPAVIDGPPVPPHLAVPLVRHGYDPFDMAVLALALAPDIEPAFGRVIGWLHRDPARPRPTLDLLARLCCEDGRDRTALAMLLSSDGPLVGRGLVETIGDGPVGGPSFADALRPSAALLRWTFAVTELAEDLVPFVAPDTLPPGDVTESPAAAVLAERTARETASLSHVFGPHPGACLDAAWSGAAKAGRPVLTVRPEALTEPSIARRIAAEAVLREAVVIVDASFCTPPDTVWALFRHAIVIGGPRSLAPAGASAAAAQVVSLHVPACARDTTALTHALAARGVELDAESADPGVPRVADVSAAWTHLAGADLRRTVDAVAARARGRAGTDGVPRSTATEVADVAAEVTGGELDQLAARLRTSTDWSALVLPDDVADRLLDVCAHVTARATVRDGAGFTAQPGHGHGVSVLFAGPSGTGKTLAARLLAGRLGLPLHRVDLAAVVSKYIGETERNLDAVFAAAARTDTVLMFDEAEALFGKRGEITDARDRYANLEVSYLLQRMEDFDGLAVLATNLLHNIDEAFIRRLTYCVRFPFPDAGERRRIWQAVWPAELPRGADLTDDHFSELAEQHPLSGGHIRNVAVAATHLAAADGRPVDRAAVLRALAREYDKLGVSPRETVAGAA
ncbi:MAG TPA: ATP-binding protein [Yinghuangia sp.]|nr:ATP-binding protein [Yinghuangia sp.]